MSIALRSCAIYLNNCWKVGSVAKGEYCGIP